MIDRVTVRYTFGSIILAAHFLAIALYGTIGLRVLDSVASVMAVVLSIAPLTSLYFAAFLRYTVGDDGSNDTTHAIPRRSFYVQLVVICIFCIALLPIGGWLFNSGMIKYEDVAVFTGFVDTLFGAYLAMIFGSLFPETMTKPGQAGVVPPPAPVTSGP
ncbi:hypothetical protein NKI86_24175 [Mesorhizobium sp. M0320]|uniref:hypothetical protein n=1 Tax=unclassified Mesorhizobium TaxID=325217 RepID=UPI0033380AC7